MALRAGYYGLKKKFIDKVNKWDQLVFPRSEQAVLGAKNLLPPNVSKTFTDITFTVDEDGVVTVNGTASASRNYSYYTMVGDGKDYIINCGNPNVAPSPAPLGVYVFDSTEPRQYDVIGTEDKKITFTEGHAFTVYFVVRVGNTVTNEKIYPMLRLATDPEPTYVPYAMTNKELTVSATDQKTAINAIISAATGAADFAAFKTAMGATTPVTRSYQIEGTTEPDSRSIEEPVVEKKTTTRKKSTAKAETTEEV